MKTMLKTIVVAILTLTLLLTSVPVYANGGPPSIPQAFYGDLNLFCDLAPPGTTVEAHGAGVLTGISGNPIVTSQTGKYGGTGGTESKLVVQGNIAEGSEITFWINGIQADQTATYSSGEITELNLSVNQAVLTVETTTGGTVQKNPDQSVFNCGDTVQLTAIADDHYHFVEWSGDASGTDNPLAVIINGNKSITANFALNPVDTVTLTYTAGANGSITGTSPQTVAYGASGTAVTAVADAGYHFVDWSDDSTANPRTDTNVTANISVSANFAISVATFTLTYTAGANGTISGISPQTVNYGANGSAVTALANIGYHFVDWSDTSTANPRTDTNVTADISVSANFAINPVESFTLAYTAGANGSITGMSPQTVAYGANGTAVTAVPNAGYHFFNWSDSSTANPRTDTNVTADISVTANFDIGPALPQAFYGNLNLFCAPALPVTTVEARGAGVLTGIEGNPIITTEAGKYGGSGDTDSKLVVQGNIAEGTEITFWINGIQADQTAAYSSGEVTELNLSVNQAVLTVGATAGGTVQKAPDQSVFNCGDTVQLTAVADAHYHFVEWSGDASGMDNPLTVIINGNKSISANFALNPVDTITLTYTAGANGTISGISPQTVNYGANGGAVTALANIGYHFVNWSDASTANPRTDNNVTADISVTANFAINVATFTLTYTAGANGTISGISPQTVNYGDSGSSVTAVANIGYHFVDWSDAYTANPRTDNNVTADISVTANFAINPDESFTLTYTAGANGTISGISPQTVTYGDSGSAVTAVANLGYHFVDWSDASTANPRTDTNVTADISVSANFAINVATFTLTYTAGANGTISGISPQTVNYGANGSAVTALANIGYHFVNWSDASTANPRTDTNVTADISVTANFAINPDESFTLTYTAGANGSITGMSPQTVAYGANGTAVTAVPNAGYHFYNWSDSSTANPRTDTNVTADISVTANFAINPVESFTLAYTAGANGSITGMSPQTVAYGANGTAVTAVPNAGYHFFNWSDSSTANPRTDTNVTADISITANFAQDAPGGTTYNLMVSSTAGGDVTTPGEGIFNYPTGAVIDLVAVADAGYHFVSWSGPDVSAVSNVNVYSTSIIMNGNYSITANFQINLSVPLCSGWNILSTPVTLADECDTIAEFIAFNDLVIDAVSPLYSYNSQIESWVIVTANFVLTPCDAVYIKLSEPGTASFIPNPTPSVTSKQLYSGWNLVSLAAYGNMPVNEGFASIHTVTNDLVGYSQVVSPELCEQQYWFYTRFSNPENMPELVVGYGYWVYMVNGGTLAGFTFTPS